MGEDVGYTSWQLPSRGRLYGTEQVPDIPDGSIEIRKMTGEEMEKLVEAGSRAWDRVNQITNLCAKLPNEFPPKKLLVTDRLAILIGLRIITHGPQYTFTYRCQHCSATVKSDTNLIEELDERTPEDVERKMQNEFGRPDFVFDEPLSLTLPDSKHTVYLRFFRGEDEELVMKREKKNQMQQGTGGGQLTYRQAMHIVGVDEDREVPQPKKEDFVRHLSAADQTHIQNFLDEAETGYDMTVYPDCTSCGGTSELVLPFGTEFFRPRSRSFG